MNFLEKEILWKEILLLGSTAVCTALASFIWRQVTTINTEPKEQFFQLEKIGKKVCFADVAGCDKAKEEIVEIMESVLFLKNSKKYEEMGAKIPRSVLLVGPPGTGKTLLAKATAWESGVSFLSTSGSDFAQVYVGAGPSRVRSLFSKAKKCAPSIIFIDEIDAIGRAQQYGDGNGERDCTLSQLLVEMDELGSTTRVFLLAGTNRPDILDKALLRPGRFDHLIPVDIPDLKGREQIFKIHTKNIKLDPEERDFPKSLAKLFRGFTGAGIANLCNEAALIAVKSSSEVVKMLHFISANDRIKLGLEKPDKITTQLEREIIAYHETGHAVICWLLEHAEPLLKVTIVPRGVATLGFTQYFPGENLLMTEEKAFDMACVALGGRACEEVMLKKPVDGSQDDLEKVTKMAYDIVALHGYNKEVGLLSFPRRRGSDHNLPYSCVTNTKIDEEVKAWVRKAYERTMKLIENHSISVDVIVGQLLKKGVLYKEDIIEVLGEPRWKSSEPSRFEPGIDLS